jgi:hypothetical protein
MAFYLINMKARKPLITKITLLILFCSTACAPKIDTYIDKQSFNLTNYNNIAITTKSFSTSTNITSSHSKEGQTATANTNIVNNNNNEPANTSLELLTFELRKLGFNIVQENEAPDVIIEFTIGNVRYDPLVGWIADQAIISFLDGKTRKLKAQFKAGVSFITPTTESLVSKLIDEIKKQRHLSTRQKITQKLRT